MELLKTLYWIHSPSGFENGIQGFIRQYLYTNGIKFFVDDYNQTFNFDNKDRPLIIAHADQVSFEPLTKLKENGVIIKGDSNIGADDKNGIWILLNLLKEDPFLNFCFSNKEEVNGDIDSVLYYEKESIDTIPYCLVFDRTGSSDIIGSWNGYCTDEFEDKISGVGKDFGFKPGIGTFSDCDEISDYLNCVNLSCGYYKAHTKDEYTIKSHLLNSLQFGKEIIKKVHGPFKHVVTQKTWYNNWSYEDLKNDSYSACPKCNYKMEILEVYDFESGTDIAYGEVCPECFYELYYSSYDSYIRNKKPEVGEEEEEKDKKSKEEIQEEIKLLPY